MTDETSRKVSSKDQNPERTRTLVQSDPEIMAGAPVFRGTRVPVYLIADMTEQGTPINEILDGYPSLTREMVGVCRNLRDCTPATGPVASAALVRDEAVRTEEGKTAASPVRFDSLGEKEG